MVELLLVFGILVLLAAILIPLFLRLQKRSSEESSATLLMLSSSAALLYTTDYDDTFPISLYATNRPGGQIKAPAKVFAVYDALQPYSRGYELFDAGTSPQIEWATILSAHGFQPFGNVKRTRFAFNFALFQRPVPGSEVVVHKATSLPSAPGTTMFFSGRYVQDGEANKDAPSESAYRNPSGVLSPRNFPGTAEAGVMSVSFADGHVATVTSARQLRGSARVGTNSSGGVIDCYSFPFDLNGIPGVIAEPPQ